MNDVSDESTPASVRIDFSFATALAVVAAVAAALLLVAVFGAASRPIGWALACAVVAALLYPIIGFLDRHMPHALAVLVTLLGLAAVLGGFYLGVASTIADNIETLKDQAPAAATELEADNEVARDFGLESRVTAFVEDLDERLGTQAQLERSTSTVSTYVVTGVNVGSALTNYDFACFDNLAAKTLDSKSFGLGISSIISTTACFFMCHGLLLMP